MTAPRMLAGEDGASRVAAYRLGEPGYPPVLAADHQAPGVLYSRGDIGTLMQPRVAVVGTRSATHYGEEVAAELGRDLARAGVAIVSGLALGIDGAAHHGALNAAAAPPAGVVASGLDVVYPRRRARLWDQVATKGVLLSEYPLGTPAAPWRFPLRNRIIAALAQIVVVVECHRHGDALHTVEAAAQRGIPVMAVPGSVRSAASVGTNSLLADGCQPVRDADDVLAALDLERTGRAAPAASPRAGLSDHEMSTLRALDWSPTTTDEVLRYTGMELAELALVLHRLEEVGLVRGGGGWWERTG